MNRVSLQVRPELTFFFEMNLATVQAIQRALAYAIDHMAIPPDDPARVIAEAFFKLLKDVELNQSMLGSMGVNVNLDLSNTPPAPPKPPMPVKEAKAGCGVPIQQAPQATPPDAEAPSSPPQVAPPPIPPALPPDPPAIPPALPPDPPGTFEPPTPPDVNQDEPWRTGREPGEDDDPEGRNGPEVLR